MRSTKRYESLDGLRGICALLVTLQHCDGVLHSGHLVSHAYLCVDVFFALSGFVIAMVYEARLKAGFPFSAFVRARARRLLPTHFLSTGIVSITVIIVIASGLIPVPGFSAMALASNIAFGLLLIPNFFSPAKLLFPIIAALWSLLDEWIVNFIYAVGIFRLRTRTLSVIVLACWCALAIHGLHSPSGLNVGATPDSFLLGIVRATAGFLAGAIAFRLHANSYSKSWRTLRPELVYSIVFLASSVAIYSPVYDLFIMVLAPIYVALLARSDMQPGKMFVWLGAVSYPLYISQYALLWGIGAIFGSGNAPRNLLFLVPIVAAELALAWAINRAVAMKLRHFRWRQKRIA
jgi:peptidoglycan/LPS O-acetylase OafA/YrhL